jgi:hypothetical protein
MVAEQIDQVRRSDFMDWQQIVDMIKAAFRSRNANYDKERKQRKDSLSLLTKRIAKIEDDGTPLPCSQQIALEVGWLLNYTDDWARADRRLVALEASLGEPQAAAASQDQEGSWGGCCSEPYRRLEPTVDALQSSNLPTQTLKPLRFMSRLQDQRFVLNYLYDLQTTDIARTGRNNRDELGAVQSALSQLIFKDQLQDVLSSRQPQLGFAVSDDLEIAYLDYLRQTQHPRSGYWGPWYRLNDRLYMLQDVSFTFHIIKYRSGEVDNWPKIVDSTFMIKDFVYPYGWRPTDDPDGPDYADHHNYDIAQILAYGWPHMSRIQKKIAAEAVQKMLEWCLTKSVKGDGFVNDGDQLSAYYFGVRFLDLVGFWDEEKRFWTTSRLEIPNGAPGQLELAERLLSGLDKLKDDSEEAVTVRSILRRAQALSLP